MDTTAKQDRKLALTTELASQRQALTASHTGLKRELSLPNLLKRSVQEHPVPWFAGSLGSATLFTLLLRRPSVSEKRRGPFGLLFGLGFSLAKPALLKWGANRLKLEFKNYLDQQNQKGRHASNSRLG